MKTNSPNEGRYRKGVQMPNKINWEGHLRNHEDLERIAPDKDVFE
jgi:hypothetical protein